MTLEEATAMREAWISTFTEMKKHMNPEKALSLNVSARAYGMERFDPEDEEDEDEGKGREYMCRLPCGQIRNRCSYNASCNTQLT